MNPLIEVLLVIAAGGAIVIGEMLAKKAGIKPSKPDRFDKKGGDKNSKR